MKTTQVCCMLFWTNPRSSTSQNSSHVTTYLTNHPNKHARHVQLFTFIPWFAVMAKSTRWQVLFFLLIKTRSGGLLASIEWSICTWIEEIFLSIIFSISEDDFLGFLNVCFSILLNHVECSYYNWSCDHV